MVRSGDRLLASLVVLGCAASLAWAGDLASLSDEFNDPSSLSRWQRVDKVEQSGADQLARLAIEPAGGGRLVMTPHASVWYQDFRGVLLFKEVTGNFVVTTKLKVTGRDGSGAPKSQFSLAGIMVRAPRQVTPATWRPGGENYMFLSLGAADRPGRYQLEVKTTQNSRSQLQISDGAPEAELRCARIGDVFIMLQRLPGQPWVVHRRYRRADMPATLQVGLTCYTDWPTCQHMDPSVHNQTVIRGGNPDLTASVDYVRFERPGVPAGWAGRDLADAAGVSDAQLLEHLGDRADQ